MIDKQLKPEPLEIPVQRSSWWPYLLIGALMGAAVEMLVSLPLDALFRSLFEFLFKGSPISLHHALAHLARPGEWPAVSLTGFIFGAALGYVLYRLKKNHKRLQYLQREFEIQVATLRHHYKNLALGISGFSGRARRKLRELQEHRLDCSPQDSERNAIQAELDSLELSVAVLEDTSRRLTATLTKELKFLKALQSHTLIREVHDFYPVLRHAIQDLMDLRFREKQIQVEINGQPWEAPSSPLVFAFEPYTMEIILQNILSNAMRYGEIIRIRAAESNGRVRVEISDNGPGIDLAEIKRTLVSSTKHPGAESTHLGLRVTLHLLEQYGGRLFALSEPGQGATFILEF